LFTLPPCSGCNNNFFPIRFATTISQVFFAETYQQTRGRELSTPRGGAVNRDLQIKEDIVEIVGGGAGFAPLPVLPPQGGKEPVDGYFFKLTK